MLYIHYEYLLYNYTLSMNIYVKAVQLLEAVKINGSKIHCINSYTITIHIPIPIYSL